MEQSFEGIFLRIQPEPRWHVVGRYAGLCIQWKFYCGPSFPDGRNFSDGTQVPLK